MIIYIAKKKVIIVVTTGKKALWTLSELSSALREVVMMLSETEERSTCKRKLITQIIKCKDISCTK